MSRVVKAFIRDYRISHWYSPLRGEYFDGKNICVLDIEATGLAPSRSKLILMGLLTETAEGVRATQFLAENSYEEDRVLDASLGFLYENHIDCLVTYNGARYDLPFIAARLERLHMGKMPELYDFDLYRYLRKCSVLPGRLDSLSQGSVESFYGIRTDRQDTISGRESVSLYEEYAVSGNPTAEKIILTHNREDVLQLYKLLKLACGENPNEWLSGDYHAAMACIGYPTEDGRFVLRPTLAAGKSLLKIRGDQLLEPFSAAYYPDAECNISAGFSAATASLEIDVPLQKHNDSCFYDLQTFLKRNSRLPDVLLDDHDCVNGYLIMNSRTVNLLAELIAIYFAQK